MTQNLQAEHTRTRTNSVTQPTYRLDAFNFALAAVIVEDSILLTDFLQHSAPGDLHVRRPDLT